MKHIAMVSHSAVTETNRYYNTLENLKQGWDKKLNPFLKWEQLFCKNITEILHECLLNDNLLLDIQTLLTII
jgi:hypothetical protein